MINIHKVPLDFLWIRSLGPLQFAQRQWIFGVFFQKFFKLISCSLFAQLTIRFHYSGGGGGAAAEEAVEEEEEEEEEAEAPAGGGGLFGDDGDGGDY